MEKSEFETMLIHLGQDIGYMGLRVQKDAQKYLKDLKTTHDNKKFCSKLAEMLKKFSKYTIQYAKDLEDRIKDFNRDDEYNEITCELRKIICDNVGGENGVDTSNSLGPPNNNTDESTELTNYNTKKEVLSQCSSVHLGGEDEIKSEQLTQYQPLLNQNEHVLPNNDLIDSPTRESLATQQPSNDSGSTIIYSPTNPSNVEGAVIFGDGYALEQEVDSGDHETAENDDSIANSLEISHSEEIQSSEDQDDVVLCISDRENIPNIDNSNKVLPKEDSLDVHPVTNSPLHIDNAGSNDQQKLNVIPLPYKLLFEEEKELPKTSDEPQKMNVIPLPYKPIFEKEKDAQEIADLDTVDSLREYGLPSTEKKNSKIDSVAQQVEDTTLRSRNFDHDPVANFPEKADDTDLIQIDDDDSDVEIISVVSRLEENHGGTSHSRGLGQDMMAKKEDGMTATTQTIDENDSDVEIIEDALPPIVNITGEEPVSCRDSSDGTVNNSSKIAELENINESDDSNVETIANNSSGAENRPATPGNGDSNGDLVTNLPGRVKIGVASPDMVENDSDTETIANISPREADNVSRRDYDQDTVFNSPQRENRDAELANIDEIDRSDLETIANTSPRDSDGELVSNSPKKKDIAVALDKNIENDSDSETVANISPREADNVSPRRDSDEDTVFNSPQRRNRDAEMDRTDTESVATTPPSNCNAAAFQRRESNQDTEDKSLQRRDNSELIDDLDVNSRPKQPDDIAANDVPFVGSPRQPNDDRMLPNSDEIIVKDSLLATSLDMDDDVITPQSNDSESTVANLTPPDTEVVVLSDCQVSENDSDDTIVGFPSNQQVLKCVENDENDTSPENTQSSEIFDLEQIDCRRKVSKDAAKDSDSEPTQRELNNSAESCSASESKGDNDENDTTPENTQLSEVFDLEQIDSRRKVSKDAADNSDSEVDFDQPTQRELRNSAESCSAAKSKDDNYSRVANVDAKTKGYKTNDNNGDLIGLIGSKAGDTVDEGEGDQEEVATQDIAITHNKSPGVYKDITEAGAEDKENSENDMASQNSFVFDLETEQQHAKVNDGDGATLNGESSEASTKDKTENVSNYGESKDGDRLSISEFETGPSTCGSDVIGNTSEPDNQNEETKKDGPKKRLKANDRKSLLRVIAEYYLKRKKERAESIMKERHEKPPGENNEREETKKRKHDYSAPESSNMKGCKDFPISSRIDESSNSSVEVARNDMDIEEDSSDVSDVKVTQIENIKVTNAKEKSTNEKNVNERSDQIEEQKKEETRNKITIEADKRDSEDSDDSKKISSSSKKATKDKLQAPEISSSPKKALQTFSDFLNQRPLTRSESDLNNKNDAESDADDLDDIFEEVPRLVPKVEGIRKLRKLTEENATNDDVFAQPTQTVSDNLEAQLPKDIQDRDIQNIRSPKKENDATIGHEGQVVSPILPPSNPQSGDEDAEETDVDNQVVSPFKKKGVKRLRSSDESDSEPAKKISEAKDSQESDIHDCATQEIVKPFKRTCVKRLLSTDDESELTRRASDNDDNEIKRGFKRRKVGRLPSSEFGSPEELNSDQVKDKQPDEIQIDSEEDGAGTADNIEPSQFKLDDNARDDLLQMLNKHTRDTGSSDEEDNENSEQKNEDVSVEPSQFKLGDCDRDNLLNMLTDKENDEKTDEEEIEPSQFKLSSDGRNQLLGMLDEHNDDLGSSDDHGKPEGKEDESRHKKKLTGKLTNKTVDDSKQKDELSGKSSDISDVLNHNIDQQERDLEKNEAASSSNKITDTPVNTSDEHQFELNNEAGDAFLDILSSEQSGESTENGADEEKNLENKEKVNSNDNETNKCTTALNKKDGNLKQNDSELDEYSDRDIEPSQFKLNSQARDAFLDMLSSEQSDDSRGKKLAEDKVPNLDDEGTNQSIGTLNHKDTKSKRTDEDKDETDDEAMNMLLDNITEEVVDDEEDGDDDDRATENSQGIDDELDELDEDTAINQGTFGPVDEDEDNNEDNEATATEPEFHLDEDEKIELLNMLSDHLRRREASDSESNSGNDKIDDGENENEGNTKMKTRKSENIDRDMLFELLQEYENAVSGKDSGADSDSVLLDLLRVEPVDQSVDGRKKSPKKPRDTSKEAWDAYQLLLKDNEEFSDSSSELSNVDIDNLQLDFSDQEKRQKEKNAHNKLRRQFNINEELFIDVEQADISGFDVSSLPTSDKKYSTSLDRLCDISNVLQKRKTALLKRRACNRKLRKLSARPCSSSFSSHSGSDGDSSSGSNWTDDSVHANRDSASNRDSPFQHLSDDNDEQAKLANALWDDIKNSSDDNGGWSSDNGDNGSSDDEGDGKGKGRSGGGGGKRTKRKKKGSDGEEKDGTEDETGSEKNAGGDDENDDSGDESGKEKKKRAKEADLDSSDEEDFVGVRKGRGAWKHDPLLKSCLTSDEDSDSNSDTSQKKKTRTGKIRKRPKRKRADSDDAERVSQDDMKTPTKKSGNSSDSDVEFVMAKKKTPKKAILITDDEVEDDSPSKKGKGRRNIRALVEDDELAEATQQAKKEENDRIKRLQEREKAKETFTQSLSFGSQLSEDESDPLILDVNEELQIKVHPKISKKLKPHQRFGIQFMWDSCYESVEQLRKGYEGSGCILAHCMGLGKTLQALGLIHTLFNYKVTKTKHVLVVCPLSTVANWRNEYRLAYKDIKHSNVQLYTIQDKKAARKRFQLVNRWRQSGGLLVMGYECFGIMINDEKLDKWEQQELCEKKDILKALVDPGPDLVICDEGHLLRNKQTQRNLALNKVETKRRIVLTGTPLQNNLLEYYCMVHFVKPNLLGTEKEYKTNFINPIINGQFEDSTAVDILYMKKRTHVLHKILNKTVQRVEDTELKQYLPELVDQALFVRLSDLQVNFYNTYLDSANARPVVLTAAGNISRKNFLADNQILKYICTHPDIVTIAKRSGKPKIKEQDVIDDNMDDVIEDKVLSTGEWFKDLIPPTGVKDQELGTKMMVALGIVEEAATNNDKVLIFSQSHAEMDCLEFFLKQRFKYKKGVDYNRMDGTISPEVRTQMCDAFNSNNKKLRVFIMSTKVGGLGLNLTAANRVIIMNVNWNPSYDTQSVFRAFRFGQTKSVYVYRLIAIDTMEEKMYQRQVTKLAVAHRVVDKHQITRHYSAADIQEFYSARPTIEGERPLPNVPEDRILAKLIQKFQFLYKWHEHQALLANRPEEDLNEQQKNSAWEEFNKKAVEPPPPPPGMPPSQFVTASSILNLPGPSGSQIRMAPPGIPPGNPQKKKPRSYTRRKKKTDPVLPLVNPVTGQVNSLIAQNTDPRMVPVAIKQTPSGLKLVMGKRQSALHISLASPQNTNTVRQFPGRLPGRSMTVSVNHVRTVGVPIITDDAARKIEEINSLVSAQTTPELIPEFSTATMNTLNANTTGENDHVHARRIEEINSIISARLSQPEAFSSPDWADDGMNETLLALNLSESNSLNNDEND